MHIAQRPPGLYAGRPLIRTAGLAPVPFIASITNAGAICSVPAANNSRCVDLASSGLGGAFINDATPKKIAAVKVTVSKGSQVCTSSLHIQQHLTSLSKCRISLHDNEYNQ